MVNWISQTISTGIWVLAQKQPQSVLQRMTPEQRAKVLAALAAFVILGFGLVALAWLGARVTRRYMNPRPIRRRDFEDFQDDWSTKPLTPPESKSSRRGNASQE